MDTKRQREMFDWLYKINNRTRNVTTKMREKLHGWLKELDEAKKNRPPRNIEADAW